MTLYTLVDGSNYVVDAERIITKPVISEGEIYKVIGFAEVIEYRAGIPMVRNKPLFEKGGRKNQDLMDTPKQGLRLVAMTVDSEGKHVGQLTDKNTIFTLPIRNFR